MPGGLWQKVQLSIGRCGMMGVFSAFCTWQLRQASEDGGPLCAWLMDRGGAALKNSLTTQIITTTPITAIKRKKLICPLLVFLAMECSRWG